MMHPGNQSHSIPKRENGRYQAVGHSRSRQRRISPETTDIEQAKRRAVSYLGDCDFVEVRSGGVSVFCREKCAG